MPSRSRDIIAAGDYARMASEDGMQTAMQRIVDLKGGRLWHNDRSDACPEMAGFWDTTILLPGTLVCLELKSQQRRWQSAEQRKVAELLATVERVVAGVVRPDPKPGERSYDDVLELLRRA